MEEIWRSVCGYEGYYIVSNLGAVRALDRKVVRKDGVVQLRKGHLMVQTPNSDGYPMVNLLIAIEQTVLLKIWNGSLMPKMLRMQLNRGITYVPETCVGLIIQIIDPRRCVIIMLHIPSRRKLCWQDQVRKTVVPRPCE